MDGFDQPLFGKSRVGQKKDKLRGNGGTPTSFISEGSGLAGALTGAAIGTAILPGVGTVIGAGLGGGLGGFGGSAVEQKVRNNEVNWGQAGREGLVEGVLSAGPLKLGKAGYGAFKAGRAGTSLAKGATEQVGKSLIKEKVGKGLLGASDSLATRALKINDSGFATDFANRTGEEIGQFATRHNIVGKSAGEIRDTVYKPAQDIYKEGIKAIGTVPKADVVATVRRELADKLKSSFPEDRKFAKSVLKQTNDILAGFGDDIPATELNKLKSEAYRKVNTKLMDKAGAESNNAYEAISNALRKSVGDAADKAGITIDTDVLKQAGLNYKATTLNDLGQELFGLEELTKKIDVKSRVGKGSLPAGLTKIGGATAGGTVAGAPGMVVGAGAAMAANSKAGMRAASKSAESLGNKLLQQEGKSLYPVPGSLVGSLMNSGMTSGQERTQSATTMPTNMTNPNASIDSELSADSGAESNPYPKENLMADLQRDPANAKDYLEYYQMMQEVFATPDPTADMSQSSRNAMASSDNAINTIDQLEGLFSQAGGGSGRVGGSLKGWAANAGFDENAKVYNSLSQASVTQIAKALAGSGAGTVSDMDAKVIIAALPTLRDTPAEAQAKFAALKQRLSTARNNTLLYGAGGDPSLDQALTQGQY